MGDKPKKVCKGAGDNVNHQKRPAPYEGPRCATCWKAEHKRRKVASHRTYVAKTYGVPKDFYDQLYKYQDGFCALCRHARGIKKRLANDHDHRCCPGAVTCGKCLRGLLCSGCNQIIGRWGNNPDVFLRGFRYLVDPPAQRLMRELGMIDDDRGGIAGGVPWVATDSGIGIPTTATITR